MSLLEDRSRARMTLDNSVKNLMSMYKINGKFKTPKYNRACTDRVITARKQLYKIDKELCGINHAGHPKVEMYAKLMLIFKPELKKQIEDIVTIT